MFAYEIKETMDNLAKILKPKQSILVIDDNADILTLQKIILDQAGYDVYTAESGEAAVQVLSEIDEPDLILLDMNLEDMSGIEFLAMLEETRPKIVQHVPVVFVTGMDEVSKSKAVGFIRKPTGIDKLLKAVRHFIEIGHHAPYKH